MTTASIKAPTAKPRGGWFSPRFFVTRALALAALFLQHQVRFFFGDTKIALEDSLSALNNFARLEFFRKLRIFFFETSHLDFGTNQKSDGGDQLDFGFGVHVRLAVLQVDDSHEFVAAKNRYGKKRFIAIFGQFVERLKT